MEIKTNNVLLNILGQRIRKNRPLISENFNFNLRRELIANAPFVSIWFRSRGCKHDLRGGCTMCNYGASTNVAPEEMVESVRIGLSQVGNDPNTMLLVSPSGSMLDEWEVPAIARDAIFDLVSQTNCKSYICETRADSITEAKVIQYASKFHSKVACIEMGLESAHPWIMKYCINKDMSLDEYSQAVQLMHKYNVVSVANIMLGAAFLTPREAINDTVASVKWALTQGVNNCVIFPSHVKKWTLVEWLWENGLYSPPSLWSLIEVLKMLGPESAPRATISWYKTYLEESPEGLIDTAVSYGYLVSPTTCPSCQPRVMELLDSYRNTNDYKLVLEMSEIKCGCKDAWVESVKKKPSLSLEKRVEHAYEIMGKNILGLDWWQSHSTEIINNIAA